MGSLDNSSHTSAVSWCLIVSRCSLDIEVKLFFVLFVAFVIEKIKKKGAIGRP
jgi:hypothetical protein